jgi:hypothetical protein
MSTTNKHCLMRFCSSRSLGAIFDLLKLIANNM